MPSRAEEDSKPNPIAPPVKPVPFPEYLIKPLVVLVTVSSLCPKNTIPPPQTMSIIVKINSKNISLFILLANFNLDIYSRFAHYYH